MKKEPKQIRTEIVIQASPEKVWAILVDFAAYKDWNPFIKSIRGNAVEGSIVKARIEPPGASGMNFSPKILTVNKEKELRWLGHLFIPGLFDGEHIFELYENTDGTTTLVQREIFRGILVGMFSKMLDENSTEGFRQMNRKLKDLAEAAERS